MTYNSIAVFDFDWSLIEQDSDFWVIHSLSPAIWNEVREKQKEDYQWTDLMDYALCKLQDNGVTKEDIASTLSKIPFTMEMRNVLLDLKNRNVPVILLSDANTFYIKTILSAYNVEDCVTEIITNPAYEDDQGRLRVHRHVLPTGPQHGCANPCALNICKGHELDRVIEKYGGLETIRKIAYTGDGKNDFCPATRLRDTDAFFMRQQKGLETYFTQYPEEKERITSKLVYWNQPVTVWETMPKFFAAA